MINKCLMNLQLNVFLLYLLSNYVLVAFTKEEILKYTKLDSVF